MTNKVEIDEEISEDVYRCATEVVAVLNKYTPPAIGLNALSFALSQLIATGEKDISRADDVRKLCRFTTDMAFNYWRDTVLGKFETKQ